MALELAMCVEAIDRIAHLWDIRGEEDRQGLVRNLFEYLVYDLDTQRITDFRPKPWADRFLILRAALYEDDGSTGSGGNIPPSDGSMDENETANTPDSAGQG